MNSKNLEKNIFVDAIKQSFVKLLPKTQIKNPVMFVVYIGAALTSMLYLLSFAGIKDESPVYCGLPCFLPTLRKPWLKAEAELRPTP